MDKYLHELIKRMNDQSDRKLDTGHDSSKTLSWNITRESEKLDNKDFVSQLITYIDTEKDKKKRDRAYFILGHIAKNIDDNKAVNYLIQRIDKESDKYVIASLLDRIAGIKKPLGTDLKPIINAIKNDRWLIKQSAIRALNLSADKIVESTLIEILEGSDDPYNLTYANAVLNKIGTPMAIPYLEKHLSSRKRDVKDSAKYAIEEINKRLQQSDNSTSNEV